MKSAQEENVDGRPAKKKSSSLHRGKRTAALSELMFSHQPTANRQMRITGAAGVVELLPGYYKLKIEQQLSAIIDQPTSTSYHAFACASEIKLDQQFVNGLPALLRRAGVYESLRRSTKGSQGDPLQANGSCRGEQTIICRD